MDVVSAKWFSEMGIEEYNILNDFGFISDNNNHLEESLKQSLSAESYTNSYSTITTANNNHKSQARFEISRPSKHLKISNSTISSSQILCFDNAIKPKKETVDLKFSSYHDHDHDHDNLVKMRELDGDCFTRPTGMKGINDNNNKKRVYSSIARAPSQAQDHIMAERKRREKLSQRFIALSAIVPGLKKTDKASVLGDAINYLKEMQERVKILEEQSKKRSMESVVFIKKSQLLLSADNNDQDTSSSNNDPSEEDRQVLLPEIEARVSEKDVLVRIHCENKKGLALKVLSEVEKLHLCIVHSSIVPFGSSILDITIVAQMDDQFNMSVKDLVKSLRLALLKK